MRAALIAVLWVCGACQPIVGIRERTSAISEECADYCAHVDAQCEDAPAYKSTAHCQAFCANLDPPGSPDDSLTLACLEEHTGRLSESAACEAAGPSGGGKCGAPCKGYCKLYERICGELPAGASAAECEAICGELKSGGELNAVDAFEGNDTLQCRLAHLSAAALEDISGTRTAWKTHCGHARADLTGDFCVDAVRDCEHYCNVVATACIGDNQQYASTDDCKAICGSFAQPSDPPNKYTTPYGCRLQNAYTALQTHGSDVCTWAGPAGGGDGKDGCGTVCGGYCELLAKACPKAGFEIYGTDNAAAIAACSDECVKKDHPGHPRQFDCRLENIADALQGRIDDKTFCEYAFGGGPCGPGSMGK